MSRWVFILILALGSCEDPKDLVDHMTVIGHAGYGFVRYDQPYPANSLVAVDRAGMAGAHAVEIDVLWSEDNVPYAFHDGRLEVSTECTGCLSQYSSTELFKCRVKTQASEPDFSVAKLSGIIDAVKQWDMDLYLDLKAYDDCGLQDKANFPAIILALLQEKEWTHRTKLIVTNAQWQFSLYQPTGLPIELDQLESEFWPDPMVDTNFVGVMTSLSRVEDHHVELAHDLGLTFTVYNIRSTRSLREAARLGVDAVMVENVPRAVRIFK